MKPETIVRKLVQASQRAIHSPAHDKNHSVPHAMLTLKKCANGDTAGHLLVLGLLGYIDFENNFDRQEVSYRLKAAYRAGDKGGFEEPTIECRLLTNLLSWSEKAGELLAEKLAPSLKGFKLLETDNEWENRRHTAFKRVCTRAYHQLGRIRLTPFDTRRGKLFGELIKMEERGEIIIAPSDYRLMTTVPVLGPASSGVPRSATVTLLRSFEPEFVDEFGPDLLAVVPA